MVTVETSEQSIVCSRQRKTIRYFNLWRKSMNHLFILFISRNKVTVCTHCLLILCRWSIVVKVRITSHYVANANIAITSCDCRDISYHRQLNCMFKSLLMPTKQNIKTPHDHSPRGAAVVWGQFHVMTDIYVITYTHNIWSLPRMI